MDKTYSLNNPNNYQVVIYFPYFEEKLDWLNQVLWNFPLRLHNFWPLLTLYTSWKWQNIFVFWWFSGGVKRELWPEIHYEKIQNDSLLSGSLPLGWDGNRVVSLQFDIDLQSKQFTHSHCKISEIWNKVFKSGPSKICGTAFKKIEGIRSA